MTNIDEARARLELYVKTGRQSFGHSDDIALIMDALDAAERERDEESGRANDAIIREGRRTDERNELAAVIERAREAIERMEVLEGSQSYGVRLKWGEVEKVQAVLNSAPADALRRVKAEAWDEAIEEQRLLGPANEADIPQNPYRIEKGEQ